MDPRHYDDCGCDICERARYVGRAEERAAIVADLREQAAAFRAGARLMGDNGRAAEYAADGFETMAERFERGEHVKKGGV